MIIKRGKVNILHIIDGDEDLDEKKLKKALKLQKEVAKNIDEDGNKIESSKELVN